MQVVWDTAATAVVVTAACFCLLLQVEKTLQKFMLNNRSKNKKAGTAKKL